MKKLDETEVRNQLKKATGWLLEEGKVLEISKEFQFKDFPEAISFVNELAKIAEALNHHPDIVIKYNRVSLKVYTHDAGGLTHLDFDLARRANELLGR